LHGDIQQSFVFQIGPTMATFQSIRYASNSVIGTSQGNP
jgi:hypothetical protein